MPETADMPVSGMSVTSVLQLLWNSRRLLLRNTLIVTAIVAVVAFLLPKYYRSTASILPPTDQGTLGALSNLTGLASLAGIQMNETPIEQLYPSIATSESVLRDVIYSKYKSEKFPAPVNLVQYWDITEDNPSREFEVALDKLNDDLDVSMDKRTNIVTVTLLMKEPQLAADVVNRIVAELDRFVRTQRITSASEQRKWIENRLKEVKTDLDTSEERYRYFLEQNRQISSSPLLQLEQQRYLRELEMNTTVYTELRKQYEMARIEEVKNIPVVSILDQARPAGKKERPKRTIMILAGFLIGCMGTGLYVAARAFYEPQIRNFMQMFSRRA